MIVFLQVSEPVAGSLFLWHNANDFGIDCVKKWHWNGFMVCQEKLLCTINFAIMKKVFQQLTLAFFPFLFILFAPNFAKSQTWDYTSSTFVSTGYSVSGVGAYYKGTSGGSVSTGTTASCNGYTVTVPTSSGVFYFQTAVDITALTVWGAGTGNGRSFSSLATSNTLNGTYTTLSGASGTGTIASGVCGSVTFNAGTTISANTYIKVTFTSGNVNITSIVLTPAITVAPTTQASNIVFSGVSYSSLTSTWTVGDGAKRVVFVKEGVQGTISNPVDGVAYTASSDWSAKGTQLGLTGYYCVYDGNAATVSLANLNASTNYWVQIFEYNGSGSGIKYYTGSGTNNPKSQATSAAPITYYYRSAVSSGNWSDPLSWESSTDNSTWGTAGGAPTGTSADLAITVLNGHSITVNSGTAIADELTIATGGTLTVANGATLSISNGPATDLTVNGTLVLAGSFNSAASSAMTINGTFENQVNSVSFNAGSGLMTISAGGIYKINGYNGTAQLTFTNVTFTSGIGASGANLYVTGVSGTCRLPASQNGNVIINAPTVGGTFLQTNPTIISGNLTIIATTGINNAAGGSPRSLTISGDLNIQGGKYEIVASGTTAAGTSSLTVNGNINVSNGKLYISNTTAGGVGTINAKGNINYTGGIFGLPIDITTGHLVLNGSTPQVISITSPDSTFTTTNLTVSNNSGISITGTSTLDVKGVISFTLNNASLITGGLIKLKSFSTVTGRISDITNAGVNSGNSVSGNVTVERYIPAGRRTSRFLGHPFGSALTMASLIDNIYITGDGTTAGTGGASPGTGFDATGSNAASSFWFDNASQTWKAFTTTSDASWTKWSGIRVLVRGDRTQGTSITGGNPTPNAVTLDMSGAINTGLQTIPVPTGYSVLGNPYPSPVDLGTRLDATANIGTTYWVWDANGGVTAGSYVTRTIGSGAYNLAMNGAFVVQPASATSIAFVETDKQTTATANLFRTNTLSGFLELQVLYNNYPADNMFVRFNNVSSDNKDALDGEKLSNPEVNFYALSLDNKKLSLDTRPFADNKIIPLGFTATAANSFKIKVADYGITEDTYLKDKYLNTLTKLDASTEYSFDVTADPASQGQNRFELVMRINNALPTTFVSVTAAQKNAGIEVNWNTANEVNMNSYDVEESTDGINFTKGTTVAAKNATTNTYSWFDATVNNGDNFYRIKSVEKNGSTKYSNVVKVKLGAKGTEFSVYPNPVKGGVVSLQMSNVEKGTYSVRIFNNIGQEVASKTINHNGGSATQTIDLGKSIATGIYSMQITNGTTVITKTVIVE
jgi:hypothetical protein